MLKTRDYVNHIYDGIQTKLQHLRDSDQTLDAEFLDRDANWLITKAKDDAAEACRQCNGMPGNFGCGIEQLMKS